MKPYLVGTLIATTVFAAACGGGGGGSSTKEAAQARGPIKVWYSNNQEEVAWAKTMVTAWNTAHPNEKVTGQEIPTGKSSEEVIGAAITAGNAPCLVFNTEPRGRARLPEAGRPGRARRHAGRQAVRREPHRRRGQAVRSRRTASTTSCRGRPTR